MQINRADITALLRSRGQSDRADWVDRTLPEVVDTHINSALLKMLDIDLSTLTPAEKRD
ncbi:hypothetical protein DFJ67_6048 [Asanoa ferruginea]|uniref:Uncharacterized protein n=1 Tax=Asanoa ferruginea TaxID=53367 RepID=A0A3D9ZS00_9ACTN|nr:hypothetical protein [Asanoa ferruginea]REG00002.1 hypothetical protein DFJ67_6048 [Asanoa ferruginea]GIF51740.1 hypothetical protein Afe04nite_62790 [Asanoa ferruginea]